MQMRQCKWDNDLIGWATRILSAISVMEVMYKIAVSSRFFQVFEEDLELIQDNFMTFTKTIQLFALNFYDVIA